MDWNREQKQAFNDRGQNILVAAAAGSGKTAVMVERIKKIICEDKVPVKKLLIVTFTNAAAAEMKEKIRSALIEERRKALRSEAASGQGSPSYKRFLGRQLDALASADISTFHAFALKVIRRHFYLLDMEPGFRVIDEARATLLQEEAMDDLLETEFQKGDPAFLRFMDAYSSDRNPRQVRALIVRTHRFLSTLPDPGSWMREKGEELCCRKEDFVGSPLWPLLRWEIRKNIALALRFEHRALSLLDTTALTRLHDKLQEEVFRYEEVDALYREDQATDPAALLSQTASLLNASSVSLRSKKQGEEAAAYVKVQDEVRGCRDEAKKIIDSLKKDFLLFPLADQLADLQATAHHVRTLFSLVAAFDARYRQAKKDESAVDFSDIEHSCLKALEYEEVASQYRETFSHIFIDEYQDTSLMEEAIISRISRENNLFMVGDFKQSIYRFRLAAPDIFWDKYERYSEGNIPLSEAIDLNRNYRSKKTVTSYINDIFHHLMDAYDDRARLYPGIDYEGDLLSEPECHVVLTKEGSEEERTEQVSLNEESAGSREEQEELSNMKAMELEALHVAGLIRNNLDRPYWDSKEGSIKKLRLSDMVILMRSVKEAAETFQRVLRRQGIDSLIDYSEGYYDTVEVEVFMNLLAVIDNRFRDKELLSLLHSEIFAFEAEELAAIRVGYRTGSYAEAFLAYPAGGAVNPLAKKCQDAVEQLDKWQALSSTLPLSKFLWRLLLSTGYYIAAGVGSAGEKRQANLRALVHKAADFEKSQPASLHGFVKYVEMLRKKRIKTPEVYCPSGQEAVRIMTIHKSKGLEFPMVIVAGLGRKLQYGSTADRLLINRDIGIGLRFVDSEKKVYRTSFLQKLIARREKEEEIQEEVRILYVALTRAKDFLYLIGTMKDRASWQRKRERPVNGWETYLDMLAPRLDARLIPWDHLTLGAAAEAPLPPKVRSLTHDSGAKLTEEEKQAILAILNYKYPHSFARSLKSKYSVSECNQALALREEGTWSLKDIRQDDGKRSVRQDQGGDLAVPAFARQEHRLTAADRGNIYHTLMEQADFARLATEGEAYLKTLQESLAAKGYYRMEDLETVDPEGILGFVSGPLKDRILKAWQKGRLYKEHPFTLFLPVQEEFLAVQGVIDCFFEEEDGTVLLDYKSGGGKGPQTEEVMIKKYEGQIRLYARALEEAGKGPIKEALLYLFRTKTFCPIDLGPDRPWGWKAQEG